MEDNDQRQQRLKKLETLKGMGVAPYGARFEFKDRAGDLTRHYGDKPKATLEQEQIACTLAGRIVGLRRFGKAAFAVLQDGADRLQVYLKKDNLSEQTYKICEELDLGDWIGVSGVLFRTKTDEFTVDVMNSASGFTWQDLLPYRKRIDGISVLSLEGLLRMKEHGRLKDRADAEAIRRALSSNGAP